MPSSAGAPHHDRSPHPAAPGPAANGHNRISTQALTSLAKAAAAEALGVEPHDVRADWSDDDGLLALSLVSPIRIPPLTAVLRDAGTGRRVRRIHLGPDGAGQDRDPVHRHGTQRRAA